MNGPCASCPSAGIAWPAESGDQDCVHVVLSAHMDRSDKDAQTSCSCAEMSGRHKRSLKWCHLTAYLEESEVNAFCEVMRSRP